MPIIDVSQKTYRTLVKAAHEKNMSVDRFIQIKFERNEQVVESDQPAEKQSVHVEPIPFTPIGAARTRRPKDSGNSVSSDFDVVWERVVASAGKSFSTKRGKQFAYRVEAGYVVVDGSGARIPRSQFLKAHSVWPQAGPSTMQGIYGATFVWAVLSDESVMSVAA